MLALEPEIAFGRKLETTWRINPDWVNAKYELWVASDYMGEVEFTNIPLGCGRWVRVTDSKLYYGVTN